MPPTREMLQRAAQTLASTTGSLSAQPTTIVPFGSSVLRWRVTAPARSPVSAVLVATGVARQGSRTVRPTQSTTYTLYAEMFTVRKALASVTVMVNTSSCLTLPITFDELRQLIEKSLDATSSKKGFPRVLRVTEVTSGVWGKVLLDQNTELDMIIRFVARNGEVDVILEFIGRFRGARGAEAALAAELDGRIDALIEALQPTMKVHSVVVASGTVLITVCPASPQ